MPPSLLETQRRPVSICFLAKGSRDDLYTAWHASHYHRGACWWASVRQNFGNRHDTDATSGSKPLQNLTGDKGNDI